VEPQRTAVVDAGGTFTYGDLDAACRRVAASLLGEARDLQEARIAFLEPPGFGYAALLRSDAHEAGFLSAEALALGPVVLSPPLRFSLRMVRGAAAFDCGDRVAGLAELHQARAEVAGLRLGVEQAASAAVLEFRAALLVGDQRVEHAIEQSRGEEVQRRAKRNGDDENCGLRGHSAVTPAASARLDAPHPTRPIKARAKKTSSRAGTRPNGSSTRRTPTASRERKTVMLSHLPFDERFC